MLVLACVALLYKELLFYSFDPLGAQASGLPVGLLNAGFDDPHRHDGGKPA